MPPAAMPYRGVWKWLPMRKRKRVEAEEEEEEEEVVAEEEEEEVAEEEEEEVAEEEEEDVGSDDDEFEVVHLPDFPRPIIYDRRSRLDGKRWVCGNCKHSNPPSKHPFVYLPAFECGRCNAKKRKNFRFSYGNLAANGICPIGEILNQGQTDLHTVVALSGSDVVIPTLNPYSLKKTFTSSRLADGIPREEIDYKDDAAMATMMEIMETIGIQDKERRHTSRVGGVEQIDGSFEDIATELANGYPLVVEVMPGRNFDDLLYGEIYKCPFNNRTISERRRKGVITHIMILVGAARWGEIDYFYFLNSYGETFCFRVHQDSENEDEIGGIGKILATDICRPPLKFLRCIP